MAAQFMCLYLIIPHPEREVMAKAFHHFVPSTHQAQVLKETIEPNVFAWSIATRGHQSAIILRILRSNFQPLIAKLAIKDAFFNEEASTY